MRESIAQNSDSMIEKNSSGWQLVILLTLFVSVLFVSIKTIEHRHVSRTLYMELQTLEKEHDRLLANWSELKLEVDSNLNSVKVEKIAIAGLGMRMPRSTEIKRVRENTSLGFKSSVVKNEYSSLKVTQSD